MSIINAMERNSKQGGSCFFLFGLLSLAVVALFVFSPRDAYSAQATLTWAAPTTNVDGTPLTDLAGYKIYYGTASRSYSQIMNVGNITTSTVSSLNDGLTYFFAVTAYDSAGFESAYSNEVSKTTSSAQQYSFSVIRNGSGSGTVTSSSGGINCGAVCTAPYNSGSVVTLTAAPAGNSTFSSWSGGGCTGAGTCSLSINANTTVTANFAVKTYTITASAGTGGSISPSGSVTANYGANRAFTITPSTGYAIAAVKVDGASVGAVTSYTFTNVTANHTIAATFAVKAYTLTASAGTGGGISPSGSVTVNRGANRAFTITPSTGYAIAAVTVDGASVGAVTSYTFTNVTANHTIAATFAVKAYTLTASAGTGGGISPSGSVTVNRGANRAFTITPSTGYAIAAVKVDGASVGAVTSYTFTNVTANHTIAATFAVKAYTLTASAGTGGGISPSGSVTVNRGANKGFTITPSTGYAIAAVTVDGASVGAVTSYTFTNVTANHTIAATFAVKAYTLTASAGTGGGISPSGSVTVNRGANRAFTITPSTGYAIAAVKVDGASVGAVTSYTFTNVTANHTIAATFAINNTSLVSVNPTSYTFQNTRVRFSSYKLFQIKNIGKANLSILKVELAGTDASMFSASFTGTRTLSPSLSFYLNVNFKPTSKGVKNAVLRITSNDPTTPVVTIPLSGTGI